MFAVPNHANEMEWQTDDECLSALFVFIPFGVDEWENLI
jgi:hypothetical protein